MFTTLFFTIIGMIVGTVLTYYVLNAGPDDEKKVGSANAPSAKKRTINPDVEALQARGGIIDRGVLAVSSVEREGLLTGILAQLWDNINKAVCQIVKEQVEPTFATILPSPLNTLRFTKLDLGRTPIRLDNIIVHEKHHGVVQFDVDINWDGDCEIALKADFIGSVGVKTIKFHGRLACILKPLTDALPVVGAVQYYFIDPPKVQLDFTGLAQVADTSMVSGTIRKVIDDVIAGLVVLPHRMMAKIDSTCSFYNVYQPPLGVVRIHIVKGAGFQNEKRRLRSDDVPDVYCNVSLGRSDVWRTTTIKNNLAPTWSAAEFGDFLLFDYRQTLKVHVWDEDNGAVDSDDEIGVSLVKIQELLLSGGSRTMTLPLTGKNAPVNSSIAVRCTLLPLITSDMKSLTTQKAAPNTLGGLLTILVNRAVNVPFDTNVMCKVSYGDKNTFQTGTSFPLPDEVEDKAPKTIRSFDGAYHVPLTTAGFLENRHDVVMELIEPPKEGQKEPKSLGLISITHSELSGAPETTLTGKRKVSGDISLEFRVSLQGLNLEGAKIVDTISETAKATEKISTASAGEDAVVVEQPDIVEESPVPAPAVPAPPSAIRLTAISGRGFQVEKRRLKKNDVPDCYLKIDVGEKLNQQYTTKTIDNSTEPVWNESSAFLLKDNSDVIRIEAWDHDGGRMDKDDWLGRGSISVGKVILAGGTMDVPLDGEDGKPNGVFIKIKCEKSG